MGTSHNKPAHPSRYTAHYQTIENNSVLLAKQNERLAFILSVMVSTGFKLWFQLCRASFVFPNLLSDIYIYIIIYYIHNIIIYYIYNERGWNLSNTLSVLILMWVFSFFPSMWYNILIGFSYFNHPCISAIKNPLSSCEL